LLHDDDAVDRFIFQKDWPEFPHMKLLVNHCMISGAAKADLWRALVLWEYGGIYSDIDNAPGPHFNKGMVIHPDDDSYFLIDNMGLASQYFFASAPRHPLMHLNVIAILDRLLAVEEVGTQYVPYVTGPGALKVAVGTFLGNNSKVIPKTYIGPTTNRNMTIDGGFKTSNPSRYMVIRNSIAAQSKSKDYAMMGMVHFNRAKDQRLKDSCFIHLYKMEMKRRASC
jgi:mannosyltransferase OCH1-like enzyme